MPFMIDEVTYYEDIDLTQEQFYEKLKSGANIATSQPSPDSVTSLWDKLLQEYDEIVHIPMSSGLSGSCQSAMAFAADYDGRVQVVNNQRISVTQRQSALDALQLAAADKDAAQIKEFLENDKFKQQYLYYAGHLVLSEKRRTDHSGGRSHRYHASPETGADHSG